MATKNDIKSLDRPKRFDKLVTDRSELMKESEKIETLRKLPTIHQKSEPRSAIEETIEKVIRERFNYVAYKPMAEAKGRLRLYLNDPVIQAQLSPDGSCHIKVPIEIDGKMVVAKTDDGKIHWFFTHTNPDFIPVFVDLESSKLQKIP